MKNMISDNLRYLRNMHGFSQEELAEKIGVSRQSVAKWETGESLPDVLKCAALSQIYGVTLDEMVFCPVGEKLSENSVKAVLDDKYVFGIIKVGERGQVVIPKYARSVYDIKRGDRLLTVGDSRGMAFVKMKLPDFGFGIKEDD